MPLVNEIEMKKEDDEQIPFKYAITSYGADFDVEGLIKRFDREEIFIPQFQRGFVWNINQSSKFVESLLLGLPVPGIFLYKIDTSQKLMVIDGQQRLRSLCYFYQGIFSDSRKEFALTGIDSQFKGATYKSLSLEDRRRLNNAIIHATIIRQDEPDDGLSSIFLIFERLNAGGILLQPQEIRMALFHGSFSKTLVELNNNIAWRKLYGKPSPRRRDVELILRFLALYYEEYSYQRPMKEFLNIYQRKNQNLTDIKIREIELIFNKTVEVIFESIGYKAFKPKRALNAAIQDSIMIGVARRLIKGDIHNLELLKEKYILLLINDDFIKATETATSDEENVRNRMKISTRAFENIP